MAHGEFTHVDIPSDDIERASSFYEGMFGWKFEAVEAFADFEMVQPGPGGMGAGLGLRGKTSPDKPRIYVTVDSIDEAIAKLPGLGGSVVEPKTDVPGMGWYAAVNDSEGSEIGLWEDLPG